MNRALVIWGVLALLALAACSDSGGAGATHVLIASDINGNIYLVDQQTGDETLAVNTFADDGAGGTREVGRLSAIVYHEGTDTLFGGAPRSNSAPDCPACVYTLDLVSREATFLSDLSAPLAAIGDFAVTPGGRLLAMATDCDDDLHLLRTTSGAELSSGIATRDGCGGNGLGFDANGDLYLADEGNSSPTIYQVDFSISGNTLTVDNTTATVTNNIGFGAAAGNLEALNSLTTHPVTGQMLGIFYSGGSSGGGGPGPRFLAEVDTDAAEVTNIGQTRSDLNGLAWIPRALIPE